MIRTRPRSHPRLLLAIAQAYAAWVATQTGVGQ